MAHGQGGAGRSTPLAPVAYVLRADAARSGEAKNPSVDANGVSRLRDAGFNVEVERAPTLDCGTPHTVAFAQNQRDEVRTMEVAGALAAEPGAKQQTYIAFDTAQVTSPANYSNPKPGDPCHPLAAGAHPPAVAFQPRIARNGRGNMGDVVNALQAQSGSTGKGDAAPCVATSMQVRRLTPRECERLQGFPDDYTLIPHRGKPAADGPRYKALGNSMAVPCMAWIGQRIAMVEQLKTEIKNAEST